MSTATLAGSHQPTVILSPDGTGVRSTIACACGQQPRTGATRGSTMHTWHAAHRRKLGLPALPDYSQATYATGKGYPAEGMTFDEWYAAQPGRDPFGVRD